MDPRELNIDPRELLIDPRELAIEAREHAGDEAAIEHGEPRPTGKLRPTEVEMDGVRVCGMELMGDVPQLDARVCGAEVMGDEQKEPVGERKPCGSIMMDEIELALLGSPPPMLERGDVPLRGDGAPSEQPSPSDGTLSADSPSGGRPEAGLGTC